MQQLPKQLLTTNNNNKLNQTTPTITSHNNHFKLNNIKLNPITLHQSCVNNTNNHNIPQP